MFQSFEGLATLSDGELDKLLEPLLPQGQADGIRAHEETNKPQQAAGSTSPVIQDVHLLNSPQANGAVPQPQGQGFGAPPPGSTHQIIRGNVYQSAGPQTIIFAGNVPHGDPVVHQLPQIGTFTIMGSVFQSPGTQIIYEN